MGSFGPPCHQKHQGFAQRPIFHVASRSGWVNDPNAPLYWKGRYHLFYQHVGHSTSWTWGLCWGHASSDDLIHWQHHPPALTPTRNSPDQDGCFSGCAALLPAGSSGIPPHTAAAAAAAAAAAGRGNQTSAEAEVITAADGKAGTGSPAMPVLLYTGVVRRTDAPPGLRPSSTAVSELCIEKQMAAIPADPDDPYLLQWIKVPEPWLATPPAGICLNCFRDPFVLESPAPGNNHTWQIMIGAGIRDPHTGLACAGDTDCSPHTHSIKPAAAAAGDPAGSTAAGSDTAQAASQLRRAAAGTALVYRSSNLFSGWEFAGHLCTAVNRDTDGVVWECPLLVQLPVLQPHSTQDPGTGASSVAPSLPTHLFSVSVGVSPAIYWLGQYTDGKFDLTTAAGPHPLDLGDLLYAPNALTNSPEGVILWGWLSELPNPGGSHDYAGCISLPRLLHITPEGHLHQQPLPQLNRLHTGPAYQQQHLQIDAGTTRHIGSTVPTIHCDLQLKFAVRTATAGPAGAGGNDRLKYTAGIILPAWSCSNNSSAAAEGAAAAKEVAGQGVLVLYDFSSSRLTVVIGDEVGRGWNAESAANSAALIDECIAAAKGMAAARGKMGNAVGVTQGLRVLGGQLRVAPHQPVQLRLLMDYSLLEVFTGDGQVLSTRVYRGLWPAGLEQLQEQQHVRVPAAELHSDPRTTPLTVLTVAVQDGGDCADRVSVVGGPCGDGGLNGPSSASQGVGAVPCGAHLFAHGGPVVAEDLHMSAMATAWLA